MEPFFFGADDRGQFGIYHPPGGLPKDEGIVICPPLFAEYLRSYTCLRRVAIAASGTGSPVLRFDYRGTGDSAGDFEATTPEDWRTDIRAAIAELQDLSGVGRVRLIGVRAGATLAAQVATDTPSVAGLVLWDPVVDGDAYVKQLEQTHRRLVEAHDPTAAQRGHLELVGFPVSQRLLNELRAISFPQWSALGSSVRRPVKLVLGAEDYGYGVISCDAEANGVSVRYLNFDCDWSTHSEAVLSPPEIVAALSNEN